MFRNNKWYTNALLFFVSIFLAFFIGEVSLRVFNYSYSPFRLEKLGVKIDGVGQHDWRQYHSQKDSYFIDDPYLIWRPKKNYKIFNSQGFRGKELAPFKKPNEFRIFAIGDSNTLGRTDSPGWVEHLSQSLNNEYDDVSVINAGVWGYSSFQGLRRFKESLKYKPDLVIVSFGVNDACQVTISDKKYISSKKFFKSSWIAKLRISQVLFALSDKILMMNKDNLYVSRVSLKEYENNLNEMITIANKNKIEVILLTRPFCSKPWNLLSPDNFIPSYNELTKQIADDANVLIIDIYEKFRDKKEYFSDGCHFNDEGYRFAAEIVYNLIKEYVSKKF